MDRRIEGNAPDPQTIPVAPMDVARATKVLDRHRARLMRRKGVVGVGVGLRMLQGEAGAPATGDESVCREVRTRSGARRSSTRGRVYALRTHRGTLTNQVCIVIDVEKKKDESELVDSQRFPTEIDGVPVDVFECEYRPSQASAGNFSLYDDPLTPGSPIASSATPSSSGTLGMVVRRQGQTFFLTVAHLIPRGSAAPVFQPGTGGTIPPGGDRIVGDASPADWDPGDAIDAALVSVRTARSVSNIFPAVPPAAPPYTIRPGGPNVALLLGQPVEKVGAATGATKGVVNKINHSFGRQTDGRTFRNQFTIVSTDPAQAFSAEGDSGSVVFRRTSAGTELVGLLHSIDRGIPVACHFFLIRASFGIGV